MYYYIKNTLEKAEKLTLNGTPPFIRIRTSLTSSLVSLCAEGYGIFFSTPMLLQHLYLPDPCWLLPFFVLLVLWPREYPALCYGKPLDALLRKNQLIRPIRAHAATDCSSPRLTPTPQRGISNLARLVVPLSL